MPLPSLQHQLSLINDLQNFRLINLVFRAVRTTCLNWWCLFCEVCSSRCVQSIYHLTSLVHLHSIFPIIEGCMKILMRRRDPAVKFHLRKSCEYVMDIGEMKMSSNNDKLRNSLGINSSERNVVLIMEISHLLLISSQHIIFFAVGRPCEMRMR